jgi:hypothetical protein
MRKPLVLTVAFVVSMLLGTVLLLLIPLASASSRQPSNCAIIPALEQ